ncbi:MAG: DNA alkylation repair protein [Methanomassiliicoccales archaeon]|nr:DNA alkylation repair protein [Methanomassiliicoccales archaeon]NYT14423.1 DNA alkylation repair protein [Methanomassiliicoccales archaeon]
MASPTGSEGMARYGIRSEKVLGLSMGELREMAKELGKDHQLALCLWAAGFHESRILAALIDDPSRVTEEQIESWAMDFDNWAVCDSVCASLFRRTQFARSKCLEWPSREEEYVKRAGFTLMAALAVHEKKEGDGLFESFFEIIERESMDDREYVKKGVNWALRQIGKRNSSLNKKAIQVAERISNLDSKAARWIASDALRELKSEKVQERIMRRVSR